MLVKKPFLIGIAICVHRRVRHSKGFRILYFLAESHKKQVSCGPPSAGEDIAHCEVIFFSAKELTTNSKKTKVRYVGIRSIQMETHAWVRLWSERVTKTI